MKEEKQKLIEYHNSKHKKQNSEDKQKLEEEINEKIHNCNNVETIETLETLTKTEESNEPELKNSPTKPNEKSLIKKNLYNYVNPDQVVVDKLNNKYNSVIRNIRSDLNSHLRCYSQSFHEDIAVAKTIKTYNKCIISHYINFNVLDINYNKFVQSNSREKPPKICKMCHQ